MTVNLCAVSDAFLCCCHMLITIKRLKTSNRIRMELVKCDACGHKQEVELTVAHKIIPEDVAIRYGITDSTSVTLCIYCSNEIRDWYRGRVSTLTYDSGLKKFRPKASNEIRKEYQKTYQDFVDYKGLRRKRFR